MRDLQPKTRGREYRQGDHICVAYQSPEEQLSVATHYIAQGLNRREQCIYAADSPESLDAFRRELGHAGVDARAAERDGSLLLLTKHEAHLLGGVFDAERMLHMLSGRVEAALNDGYVGLRTCGDMSWLLDHAPNSEQVVEYEALLNQFFASVRATGMCQYDVSRLSDGLLNHALDTHTSIVVDACHRSNPYFDLTALTRTDAEKEEFTARLATLRAQVA